MKPKRFIVLLHTIKKKRSVRIDFESNKIETDFYEELKMEGYQIYQFIQEEFKYNMEESELTENEIEFEVLKREKKTWFGLSKEIVTDLLIYPNEEFFYPYQYGHYFYLYTKKKVNISKFEKWMHSNFPYKFGDFDDTYAGLKKEEIELMNEGDYLLITNHDYQKEFGLIGNDYVIEALIERFRRLNLKSFEEIKYN